MLRVLDRDVAQAVVVVRVTHDHVLLWIPRGDPLHPHEGVVLIFPGGAAREGHGLRSGPFVRRVGDGALTGDVNLCELVVDIVGGALRVSVTGLLKLL